jgi:putative aldouronate transport system substrate-binding protein
MIKKLKSIFVVSFLFFFVFGCDLFDNQQKTEKIEQPYSHKLVDDFIEDLKVSSRSNEADVLAKMKKEILAELKTKGVESSIKLSDVMPALSGAAQISLKNLDKDSRAKYIVKISSSSINIVATNKGSLSDDALLNIVSSVSSSMMEKIIESGVSEADIALISKEIISGVGKSLNKVVTTDKVVEASAKITSRAVKALEKNQVTDKKNVNAAIMQIPLGIANSISANDVYKTNVKIKASVFSKSYESVLTDSGFTDSEIIMAIATNSKDSSDLADLTMVMIKVSIKNAGSEESQKAMEDKLIKLEIDGVQDLAQIIESAKSEIEEAKITGVFTRILLEVNGQKEWVAAYKEASGIDMTIIKPAHNQYSQIVAAMFAAGDFPDILEVQTNDYLAFAKSGHLLPLDDFIAASEELKDIDKSILEAYRLKDGKIYGVPTSRGGGCVTYIRQDWLNNLGLAQPTTWDEFYNVLKAFTFNDPNGSGVNDTVGYTFPLLTGWEFDYYNRQIMLDAWFGFEYKNGQWVDGFLEPEFIGGLERFKLLYKEGLIDKEFFTNKTSSSRSKMYAGQAGVMEYWAGGWAQTFYDSTRSQNPNAELIPVGPIKGSYFIHRVGPSLGITKAAKNPGLIFDKFINFMNDRGEGQALFTHGVEGVHYAKVDNEYKMLPQLSNPDRLMDKAFADPTLILNSWEPIVKNSDLIAESAQLLKDHSVNLRMPEGGEVFRNRSSEIITLKQQVFYKALIGDYTSEEAVEIYKEKADALGLQDILKELNN